MNTVREIEGTDAAAAGGAGRVSVAAALMKSLGFVMRVLLVYAGLSVACFLMLRTIVGYSSFKDDVQFLAFKQAYIHNPVWKTAFYVHVFSAVIALFAGFTQFSPQFLKEYRKAHRVLERVLCAGYRGGEFSGGDDHGGVREWGDGGEDGVCGAGLPMVCIYLAGVCDGAEEGVCKS